MKNRSLRENMAVHITKMNDCNSDLQFWLKKTPQERIDAVEFLRSRYYSLSGYTTIPRITKIIQFRPHHS